MPRSDFSAYMRTSEPNIARGGVSAIISCEIELVDQSVKVIDVPRITLSEELYIQLCEHLPPFDSRLFGLRFKYPENFGGRVWLEPKKSLRKQGVMRGHVSFALSIRFFVPSVEYFQIKSDRDITLDMYFTELESMFISSQLRSSPSSVYQLAVCSLYARHGSTTSISIKHVHYLSSLKLDNTELLKHISKSSFSKNEAKMEFIKLCMQLPTYGLELHPVSCTSFGKCDIAVSIRGVSIMSGIEKLRDYPWNSIVKVLFKSRQFFIQLKRPKNETNNIGILCFECEKERACKILWRSCADYHTFFRNSVIIRNESADTNQADILKAINEERIPIVLSPQDGKYGFSFQFASNLMIISHVTPSGPAFGKLKRNDRIIQVNSEPLHKFSEESLKEYISKSGLNNSNLSLLPFQANSEFQSFETDMQQLEDDLLNQILAVRFLELERINPTLTTTVAKARYNLKKNRWRDILPYDHSRFVLPVASYMSSNDDYINANTVKVSIAQGPPSHYIASQGPLAETVEDFWRMVWASKTQMVVMLTGLVESGRPKCYQYWPEPGTILQAGAFHLETQNNQKNCNGFIMRRIKCSVRQRSRLITQLQYLDWPDHGCPENTEPFIKLLQMVHTHRLKNPEEPIVVHCSAGIGRTGVLILMETAVCLLKNRQTVRPLEIVANLRSQRPFMVQTPAQFLFCCELIVYLYRNSSQ